jgi:uncharacterized protein YggE
MRWQIAFVSLALWNAHSAHAQAVSPGPKESQIAASGRGETHLVPTLATLQIVVSTTAQNAGEAASQNAARVASTIAAIRKAGVATEDVSQSSYSISQTYDNKSRPNGFMARSSIPAIVRRIDEVGKVIDAAVAGGATDISAVQFSAANMEQARRSALAAAVREARADAEAIAQAAGGRLGRIIFLNTAGVAPGFERSMVQLESVVVTSASYPTTIIAPRELTVSAIVSGAWEFVPSPLR